MVAIQSLDITSHPVYAIAHLDSGRTAKFPKVKPAGSSDASDAAWQTRFQTELTNALNQTMANGNNGTHHIAGLV